MMFRSAKNAYFVLLPLLSLGLVFSSSCAKKTRAVKEKTVRVVLQKLKEQKFQDRLPVKGTVFPVEYATISARTEGTLDDLKVDEGDMVKKGDLLFSIDRATLENDVTVKKEEVSVAGTELATAEIELKIVETKAEKTVLDRDRAEKLIKSRAMSATDYEKVIVNWKEANSLVEKAKVAVRYRKAKLVQAETNLKIAEKNLHDAMVKAPFDCLIASKLQEEKEYVKSGTNILRLENISHLEIIAYVSANHHHKIVQGKTPVSISVDGRKCGSAVITYCARTIDPVTRTFKIKALLPKEVRLSSGMLCELDIILGEADGKGIPETAVLQTGDRFFVYTVTKEGVAASVEVKKGIVDGPNCQITNPEVLKGRKVVVSGQRFLAEGTKVTIVE